MLDDVSVKSVDVIVFCVANRAIEVLLVNHMGGHKCLICVTVPVCESVFNM